MDCHWSVNHFHQQFVKTTAASPVLPLLNQLEGRSMLTVLLLVGSFISVNKRTNNCEWNYGICRLSRRVTCYGFGLLCGFKLDFSTHLQAGCKGRVAPFDLSSWQNMICL